MKQKNKKRILFQKFLNDECNEHEIDQIIHILQYDPDIDDLPEFGEVSMRLGDQVYMSRESADLIFQRILDKENLTFDRHAAMQKTIWLKVAASLVLCILSGFFVYQFFAPDHPTMYSTNFGEVRSITLHDGTEVMLNANSELTIDQNWNETQDRLVKLKGEAFFKVAHTETDQRFIVETDGQMKVTVLGTEFNVNSRDEISHVTLSSGKVQVSVPSEDILMEPGEMVSYQKESSGWIKKTVDTELYTSWTNNLLLFRESSLKEVAQILNANFGYKVIFENDSLANLSFTGSNPANEPDLLIKTIEKSFNLKIMKQENTIYIQN